MLHRLKSLVVTACAVFALAGLSFAQNPGPHQNPAEHNLRFSGDDNEFVAGSILNLNGTIKLANTASAPTIVRKIYLGTPIAAAVDTVVTAVAIKASGSTYTIVPTNGVLDVPRNLSVTRALTGTADTGSTSIVVVGTDIYGAALTETIAIPAGATTNSGINAFSTVTSVTQSGTNTVSAGADTVSVGVGTKLGLPIVLPNATNTALTLVGVTAAGSPTTGTTLPLSTVDASAGIYNGTNQVYIYIDR